MANRAIAGARAELYFKGTTLAGWATGVSATESIQNERINVLGNIDSVEIEPIGRTVTMTADFVRILNNSIQNMGIWPKGDTEAVINFEEMIAVLFDSVTGDQIATAVGVKAENRSWRIDRNGVKTVNCTFQARLLGDETGTGQ